MKIKKLLAGVTAAALTATSLAVVNVAAADKTATYSWIADKNYLTFTYENELLARSGIALEDVFTGVTTEQEYSFDLKAEVEGDTSKGYLDWMQWDMKSISYVGNMTIEVTGRNKDTNQVETVSTVAQNKDGHKWFRAIGPDSELKFIEPAKGDLDVSRFKVITRVKITQNLRCKDLDYTVADGVIKYHVTGEAVGATDASGIRELFEKEVVISSYKNNTYATSGKEIKFDSIYAFEDTDLSFSGTDADPVAGKTLLKWANDNIGYSKGTKIRLIFAASDAAGNTDGIGWITWHYPTDTGKNPWYVSGNTDDGSAKAYDAVMVVNGRSSNLLRQEVLMTKSGNDYVAEFDWNTIMSASPSTVAGHVNSIAFALNGGKFATNNVKGDNYDNIVSSKGNYAVLKQIDIVVPEGQTPQPSEGDSEWEKTVITVLDENSGVGAELTNKALTGNGGTIIKATGTLTTNKLTYEVKLLDKDGKAVQPAGEVTLTLPIPQDMQGRTINKVTHYKHDGTSEQLDVINKDSYLTDKFVKVKTSSFSGFEIEFEDTTATEAPATEAPATEAPATEAPATEAPATEAPAETTAAAGDVNNGGNDKNIPTGFAIALVPAAIAAAGVVVAKKRK